MGTGRSFNALMTMTLATRLVFTRATSLPDMTGAREVRRVTTAGTDRMLGHAAARFRGASRHAMHVRERAGRYM